MKDLSRRVVVTVAFFCIVLGAVVRLSRLDAHVFAEDETATEMHVAGYTGKDVLRILQDGRPVRASDAQRLIAPSRERGTAAVVASLASEDPQHPPLFYVMERAWVDHAGSTVSLRRAFPALLGVLGIMAAAFLCGLATRSAIGAWVGGGLFAVSPLQIVYAQQMREYSLFATLTCLSTAMVVVLVRRTRPDAALGYALAALAGLYTFTLFVFVLLAQLTIVALLRPARRVWVAYSTAVVVALAAWIPWLSVLMRQHAVVSATNDWSAQRWSVAALGAKTLANASTTFFDLHYADVRWAPAAVLVLVILAAALASLRLVTREARAVVIALIVWCYGTLLVADIVVGGHRSSVARYVIPAFCALIVAVAAWVSATIQRRAGRGWAYAGALALCCAAVLSIVGRAHSDVWWDNYKLAALRPLAAQIDAMRLPVFVTDANFPIVLALTNYCRSNPTFVLTDVRHMRSVLAGTKAALVLTTSDRSYAIVRGDTGFAARPLYESRAAPSPIAAFRSKLAAAPADGGFDVAKAALLLVGRPIGFKTP